MIEIPSLLLLNPCPSCGCPERLFVHGDVRQGLPRDDTLICFDCHHIDTEGELRAVRPTAAIIHQLSLPIPTNDQRAAVSAMLGRESHVFITGEAGTGKTYAVNSALESLDPDSVACIAPTGMAASALPSGVTIHRFCQIKDIHRIQAIPLSDEHRKPYEKLQYLVLDEVSMVRADLMDVLNGFLRMNGPCKGAPFGGLSVCMVGDLYQLPPIVQKEEAARFNAGEYETPYFFSAHTWRDSAFKTFDLKTRVRFTDSQWADILNAVRMGRITHEGLQKINRVGMMGEPGDDAMRLYSTRKPAQEYNARKLEELPYDSEFYTGISEGFVTEKDIETLPVASTIELKESARVMVVRNAPDGSFVNGTLGEVIGLNAGSIEILTDSGAVVYVHRVSFDVVSYDASLLAEKRDGYPIKTESGRLIIGRFFQFPLSLAWACTIHKSQGLTLDDAYLNLGTGAFAAGQTYVGLSRLRSMDGLSLSRPIKSRDIFKDKRVDSFFAQLPAWTEIDELRSKG